ncbi:MAG: D-alanyl-D-alanine carboxypeptidase [Clostridiales bacterium]|nr:D-alanyl-D-alanine carboxypeptidase [Clostridiales bacterium]
MINKKRIISVAILILFLALFIVAPIQHTATVYAAESKERDWDKYTSGGKLRDSATESDYAVIMDAHTGEVLFEENAKHKRYPASITKIMTCLVVLENCDLQQYVTIGNVNVNEEGAKKIGLRRGELLTVEDLLYGLMLESGNDAAAALAIYTAGSVAEFSDMMNARAEEIGMTGTNYVNPHGLHDSKQYTTAMDMAKLTYVALKNPTFRRIVSTFEYTPPVTNEHTIDKPWYPKVWENSNRLISNKSSEAFSFNDSNGHAIGIKTGYTRAAEGTLVGAAESSDGTQEVITVVLYASPKGKWSDTITMFMYAFDFYDTINLAKHLTKDVLITTHVENAAASLDYENLEMYLVPDQQNYITDTTGMIQSIIDSPDRITRVERIDTPLVAPISKGDEVGKVDFYLDNDAESILTCTLIAAHDVEAIPVVTPEPTQTPEPNKVIGTPPPEETTGLVGYIGYILAGIAGLLLIIALLVMIRRKAKYHQYNVSARGKHSSNRNNTF